MTTIFPEDMVGVMACGFTFILRLKEPKDHYFVGAFLNSRLGRLQTERVAFGSILEHITKDDLEEVIIPFPVDESRKIEISNKFKDVVEAQMNGRKAFINFFDAFELE